MLFFVIIIIFFLSVIVNPHTGSEVLGSRLSLEDFMSLRNFCVDVFVKFVVPALERRLTILNRFPF